MPQRRKIFGKSAVKSIKNRPSQQRMRQIFNIIIEQGEDGYLISDVVELPGCHTQAKTYSELMKRTREAIELYLLVKQDIVKTKFLRLQQLEI